MFRPAATSTGAPAIWSDTGATGDDYPLTYDADGHVELPACLDRRHLERVAADLAKQVAA